MKTTLSYNAHLLKCLLLLATLIFSLGLAPAHAKEPDPGAAPVAVNINTADARALATGLSGIGPSRAEDIVRYREQFGPFTTVEQLAEVKGVGKATLEKNRERITLE